MSLRPRKRYAADALVMLPGNPVLTTVAHELFMVVLEIRDGKVAKQQVTSMCGEAPSVHPGVVVRSWSSKRPAGLYCLPKT